MWSVGQIAERDEVSKQAVSKQVQQLVERQGLTVERDGRGRISAINVVEFDHLRGRYADPSKLQKSGRGSSSRADAPSDSYDEALRQKTWHEAERRRIELAALKGNLVQVDDVIGALDKCAESIVRIVDRLPNATDDLAAAVTREGIHGLRVNLKNLAVQMRTDIAKALSGVAQDSLPVEREQTE